MICGAAKGSASSSVSTIELPKDLKEDASAELLEITPEHGEEL